MVYGLACFFNQFLTVFSAQNREDTALSPSEVDESKYFSPHRMFDGVFIPDAILSYPKISAQAKLVFGRMLKYCGRKTHCWPSQEVMAMEFGLSDRSIRTCINELRDDGLITVVQRGLQQSNLYYLVRDHPIWNETFGSPPDRKNSSGQERNNSSDQDRINPSGQGRKDSSGPLHLSSEENQFEENQLNIGFEKKFLPSFIETADAEPLDLEDPIEVFLANLYRRMGRGRIKLSRKSDAGLLDLLQTAEGQHGPGEFRAGLVAFLRTDTQSLRENKWPIRWYLTNPERYMGQVERESTQILATSGARHEAEGYLEAAMPTTGEPEAQQRAQTPRRDYLAEWNSAVPEARTEFNGGRSFTDARRLAEYDPEFTSKFSEICEVAKKIHKRQGDRASWLDFYWLVKFKEGSFLPNWKRLFGDLRHLAVADKAKPKSLSEQIIEKMDAEKAERERKAKLNHG